MKDLALRLVTAWAGAEPGATVQFHREKHNPIEKGPRSCLQNHVAPCATGSSFYKGRLSPLFEISESLQ